MNTNTLIQNTIDLKHVREKAAAYGVKALSDAECLRFLGLKKLNSAQLEAMKRVIRANQNPIKLQVGSSRDAYDVVQDYFIGAEFETLLLLCLNAANRLISIQEISNGGATGTVADPRKIFKIALETKYCCQIVLAHNHPSGQLRPSQADITLTRKIRQSGKLIEINLLDHIIYTEHGYYSFADEGMME